MSRSFRTHTDIHHALGLIRDKQAIAFKALRDHIIANKDPTVQLHKLMEEYQRLCRQNDALDRELGKTIQDDYVARAAHAKDGHRSATPAKDGHRSAAPAKDVHRSAAHAKDVPVCNPMRSSSHSPAELHCRFFHSEGGCKDGCKCQYKHASRCRDFKTATGCKHGGMCHFSHNF